MFGRKKENKDSFSSVFNTVPDWHEKEEMDPAMEIYDEPEPEPEASDIEKLFDKLMELTDDCEQWTVQEAGEDEDGYYNYNIIHKTKPISISFHSYQNENEANIFVSDEDVEPILGYDYASQIADQAHWIIGQYEDILDEEREKRHNESAAKFLSLLGD